MGVFDTLNKLAGDLGQQAKNTIDTTKLELKIKNYQREENEAYTRLGKMLYETHREILDNPDFAAIYDSIDTIKARKKHLDRKITDIRQKSDSSSEAAKISQFKHMPLDRKQSDLKITRTVNGIQIVRICPECHEENIPSDLRCKACGHPFGDDIDNSAKEV